ncbi:hypothetical protein [Vulcanisaeta sp. JCM 16161]|nr:hypothetical protein [Vulcanisaeta sp. JCM 16161]
MLNRGFYPEAYFFAQQTTEFYLSWRQVVRWAKSI